ncbi:MAG: hypothetical protein ACYC1D_19310 [Acidimicrobiales bacterium]
MPIQGPGIGPGGQGGIGLAGQRLGYRLGRVAPVGQDPPVVDGDERLCVTGAGGLTRAGLAGVAAVGVQGGAAQQMTRLPCAALGAVSQQKRESIRAVAGEVALIRAHHLIRKHFKGDLDELRETLGALANLVLDVQQHEALATLDEDEHMRRMEAMRADIAKGNRLADANDKFFEDSVAAHEAVQQKPANRKEQRP